MNYSSSNSFRRALETRLLAQSTREGVSLVRLRKMVAFDRFLARLVVAQADQWLLKGGLALQLRLGDQARTTKDIDVSLRLPKHEVHLVDILLIASFTTLTAQALWAAIQATFAAQMSGVPPALLPDPPSAWSAKYRILAEDCELAAKSLAQGMVQARAFVNPVLSGVAQGRWHPEIGAWS